LPLSVTTKVNGQADTRRKAELLHPLTLMNRERWRNERIM